MTTIEQDTWTPQYEAWRHGGWYVTNIKYPSGGCGCVSRNYPDRKWRIACDDKYDETYPNREAAARAERELVLKVWDEERERITYQTYCRIARNLPSDVPRQVARHAHIDTNLSVAMQDVLGWEQK